MPKRKIFILYANGKSFKIEGTVGTDYRFSIPKQLRQKIEPNSKVTITIEVQQES